MTYTLNGVDLLSTYKLLPSRADNSNIAIAGCWDLPARIGTTSHDWLDDNGIEPYAEDGQIFFGGRTITLSLIVNGTDKYNTAILLSNFYKAVNTFTDLVVLGTPFGNLNVLITDNISVQYFRSGKAKMKISFREPSPDLTGGSLPGGNIITEDGQAFQMEGSTNTIQMEAPTSSTGIDGYSFSQLNIIPLSFTGMFNRPEPKSQLFKDYEHEGYQVTKRKERNDVLTCLVTANNFTEFNDKIKSLYAFFTQAGEHTIQYFNDGSRQFFVKDGFDVKNVNVGNIITALVVIYMTETGVANSVNLATDTNIGISTDSGLFIEAGDFYETEITG